MVISIVNLPSKRVSYSFSYAAVDFVIDISVENGNSVISWCCGIIYHITEILDVSVITIIISI